MSLCCLREIGRYPWLPPVCRKSPTVWTPARSPAGSRSRRPGPSVLAHSRSSKSTIPLHGRRSKGEQPPGPEAAPTRWQEICFHEGTHDRNQPFLQPFMASSVSSTLSQAQPCQSAPSSPWKAVASKLTEELKEEFEENGHGMSGTYEQIFEACFVRYNYAER